MVHAMTNNVTEVARRRPLPQDPAKIVRRRYELGLTSQEVAERAGLSKGSVSLIERGLRGPAATTLAKIAAALECQPIDLMPDLPQRALA